MVGVWLQSGVLNKVKDEKDEKGEKGFKGLFALITYYLLAALDASVCALALIILLTPFFCLPHWRL